MGRELISERGKCNGGRGGGVHRIQPRTVSPQDTGACANVVFAIAKPANTFTHADNAPPAAALASGVPSTASAFLPRRSSLPFLLTLPPMAKPLAAGVLTKSWRPSNRIPKSRLCGLQQCSEITLRYAAGLYTH